MKLELMKDLYQRNHLTDEEYMLAEKVLKETENYFYPQDLDEISSGDLDRVIKHWLEEKKNDIAKFIVLMRYFRLIKRNDLFIRLTQYTGGLDVIENILESVKEYSQEEDVKIVMSGLNIPELGTSSHDMPEFTEKFMNNLEKRFNNEELRHVLAGNNHGIPRQAYNKEIVFYEKANTLEEYLKDLHVRKVAELQEHCDQNKVWFEQKITQEVVDYVKKDQEILSAVLRGDKLYMKKIPYDIESFLHADNDEDRAYFACHCPFARENIKSKKHNISKNWCYCSAGFEKYPFEIILNQKLPITCLNSAINKDTFCRFEISLEDIPYKK